MTSDNQETQKALSDIEMLKRAILDTSNQPFMSVASIQTQKTLHILALFFAFLFILMDLPSVDLLTTDVMKSVGNPLLQKTGIATIGATLLLFIAGAYYILYKQSKKYAQTFGEYTSNYFLYFKNLTIFSDVFVKYVFFCALVLAEKPEWIAPALLIFIGDWVAQGRFFLLKPTLSMALSAFCFASALTMFVCNVVLISIPLFVFLGIGSLSLLKIIRFQSNVQVNSTEA